MKLNLYELLRRTVDKQPDHAAIIGPAKDMVISYRQLFEQIDTVADRIASCGVRPGDCVGVHYPSGTEYIIMTYALWRLGACTVPIAVELSADEKQQICRDIRLRSIVSRVNHVSHFEPLRSGTPTEIHSRTVWLPVHTDKSVPLGFSDLNPAFLRFTSGTTATCKGVVLSHETVWERIHAANEALQIDSDDRIVFLLSMSYHFTVSIVSYLTFGATIVLCPTSFGETIVEAASRHKATLMYGSPTHFDLMAAVQGAELPSSLRAVISTATALSRDTAEAFYQRFGRPLGQAYGIIEVGLPCMNLDALRDKVDSVGRLLPAYEMRLRETADGEQNHEILLRGPGLIDAYYEPFRTRDEIMKDGWFSTGDLGVVDDDGYLFIRARSKDMISVAGMKFFAQEVESVLTSHESVREACVTARPHARLGEVVYAKVVLQPCAVTRPTEDELKQFCTSRVAVHKAPQGIEFVDALPRTASGKVKRKHTPVSLEEVSS